jgi:DNA-binding response OmpR family regulator
VLRRTTRTAPTHVPTTFADGDLSIDLTSRQIMVAGAPVRLTPTPGLSGTETASA